MDQHQLQADAEVEPILDAKGGAQLTDGEQRAIDGDVAVALRPVLRPRVDAEVRRPGASEEGEPFGPARLPGESQRRNRQQVDVALDVRLRITARVDPIVAAALKDEP